MRYKNCGTNSQKNWFELMDEVLAGDVKDFAKKFKNFGEEVKEAVNREFAENTPLMNVIETENAYKIQIAAPGLSKEAFKLKLEENLLHVSANNEVTLPEGETYKKREFNFSKFERKFRLPKEVETEQIQARYEQGVLLIHIPKKNPDTTENVRDIQVG
jgi:HSP20 family protein